MSEIVMWTNLMGNSYVCFCFSNICQHRGPDRIDAHKSALPRIPPQGGACVPKPKNGGPCRGRTYDLLIKSQLLYQLS